MGISTAHNIFTTFCLVSLSYLSLLKTLFKVALLSSISTVHIKDAHSRSIRSLLHRERDDAIDSRVDLLKYCIDSGTICPCSPDE